MDTRWAIKKLCSIRSDSEILLLPVLAIALAVYFLIDVNDLAWEARANATVIAYVLLSLIAKSALAWQVFFPTLMD